jgi:hypothetical protein
MPTSWLARSANGAAALLHNCDVAAFKVRVLDLSLRASVELHSGKRARFDEGGRIEGMRRHDSLGGSSEGLGRCVDGMRGPELRRTMLRGSSDGLAIW